MSFIRELKRRNVLRVVVVYLAGSWLILQVADVLFPVLQVPDWTMRVLVGLLTLGLPVAVMLAWAFNITPEGIRREEEEPTTPSRSDEQKRRLDFIIIGVLAAAVIFMVFDNYIWNRALDKTVFEPGGVNSIAVLPMQLLNNDAAQEFLADGMTASLITELSKIEALRVISRTSVQTYKNSNLTLPQIAKELGVDAVIEGTVMSIGDNVRISANLVPANADTSVWTATYDRNLGDILALHSEIAQVIAGQVKIELTEADADRLVAPPGVTANVQNLIFEGQYRFRQSEGTEGLELLEAATLSAPNYAPAWTALARANLSLGLDDPAYLDNATEAAHRALSLDESSSDAHYVIGAMAFYVDWEWERALERLNRALELNPGNGSALQVLGDYYEMLGQYEESIRLGIRSVETSPNSLGLKMNLGLSYNYSDQYELGLQSCDTGEPPSEMSRWTALCVAEAHIGLNNMAEATRYANAVLEDGIVDPVVAVLGALVLARVGEANRAIEIWNEFESMSQKQYVSPTVLAYASYAAGDIDRFFSYLDIAITEKATWAPWVATVPHFRAIHGDPRFAAIVDRMNLPGLVNVN
jgi:TolB-like protein/tetratricopeptide (TPR) repeat protein